MDIDQANETHQAAQAPGRFAVRVARGGLRGLLGVAAVASALACATTPPEPPEQVPDDGLTYFPASDWRTAQAAQVGFDATRFGTLIRDVTSGRYGSIEGLIVVRRGYLVAEHYRGWSREQAHTMQSVSKSVTSLLYGIATAGGTSPNGRLDRPVLDLFRRYPVVANTDDRKSALTMGHLLTMRTSMDFWEQPYAGSPLDELNRSSGDWAKYVLDRPMVAAPGSTWAYNSGAAILVGAAIRELTGEAPDVFARRELFSPLGVQGDRWVKSPFDGLPHCGGGLFLRPVDLARVGYLVLRHGRWGDRQIVPLDWLDESTHATTRGAPVFFSGYGSAYGYFWWLFPTLAGGSNDGIIAASGSGGQWLFVIPRLDLVVAIVAANGDGLRLLYEGLLPALAAD